LKKKLNLRKAIEGRRAMVRQNEKQAMYDNLKVTEESKMGVNLN